MVRNEFLFDSPWALGVSLDYENALHRIFQERKVIQQTINQYHGGSIQIGNHLNPYSILSLNTYIEQHRFEHPIGGYSSGLQLSHRLIADYGNFYLNEGLAKGAALKSYFETANPASFYQFRKFGMAAQASAFLKDDFNWIVRAQWEASTPLPRYQLFEIGGRKLRSFPSQHFRDRSYVSFQNDLLLTSADLWKIKIRPLVYGDWAFIQNSNRIGAGAGFQVYVHDVAIPALQIFAGYGFNPNGFSTSATIGPQF